MLVWLFLRISRSTKSIRWNDLNEKSIDQPFTRQTEFLIDEYEPWVILGVMLPRIGVLVNLVVTFPEGRGKVSRYHWVGIVCETMSYSFNVSWKKGMNQ